MAMVNKIKKGNVEKEIHDSRLPELTGEEGYCVPFVNDDGTAFQIGSIPAACLNTNCVTTEKVADSAITTDKINGGAVTEVKLGEEVLNRLPYGYNSEWSHGVQRTSYHSRSASGEPADGQEGNYNLSGGAVWTHDVYNLHKQEFLASKPTYIILGCNILGFTSLHTPIHGSYLILNEVSRDFPTDNTDDLYEIVFEGVYDGFKYTYKEVFQHMVINGMSIISVPDSYTCKREFIAKTNTIADGAITTDKVANNAITKAKIDSTSAESIADHVIHATAVYENNELVTSVEEDASTVMEWILDFDKTCAAMLTYNGVKYFLPCLYRADTSPDLEAIFGSASVFFSSAGHGELTNLSLYVDVWVEDGEEPEIGEVRLKTSKQLLLAEDGAVEGRNIEDGAITAAKIANNAVTSNKIASDTCVKLEHSNTGEFLNTDDAVVIDVGSSGWHNTLVLPSGELHWDLYEQASAGATTYKIMKTQNYSGYNYTLSDTELINHIFSATIGEVTDDYVEVTFTTSCNPSGSAWRINPKRSSTSDSYVHGGDGSIAAGTGLMSYSNSSQSLILGGLICEGDGHNQDETGAGSVGEIIAGVAIHNQGRPRILSGAQIYNAATNSVLIGVGHSAPATAKNVVAFGQYSNILGDTRLAFGNGEDDTHRSNLFEIKANGEVILGADPTGNMGAATKQYVDNAVATGVGSETTYVCHTVTLQDSELDVCFNLIAPGDISTNAYSSWDGVPAFNRLPASGCLFVQGDTSEEVIVSSVQKNVMNNNLIIYGFGMSSHMQITTVYQSANVPFSIDYVYAIPTV